MNIGNAIKELRKEKGLSQRDLAEKAGLTQTSLSQIESGVKRPNPSTIKKITDFFGISETVIYILATEITDIPSHNQETYGKLFHTVKKTFLDIFK